MFKGTDPDAFRRAGKGKTKFTRSLRYKIYKAQNAKKRESIVPSFPYSNPMQSTLVQSTTSKPPMGRSVTVSATQKQRVQRAQRYKEKYTR